MDIHSQEIPAERRFEVTASITDVEYLLQRNKILETVEKLLVDRLVAEFLPDMRTSVQAKLDYDTIARTVQTAIQARLLEEMLRGTIKHA